MTPECIGDTSVSCQDISRRKKKNRYDHREVVLPRFMCKFDSGNWQKSITGVLRRPLGYFRAVGAQRVKGGGSRLSCP